MYILAAQYKSIRYNSQEGFTLIEIMLVIGIFVVLTAMGFFFSLDSYRSYVLRSEHATLVTILTKTRSHAMNNFDQSNQGIVILDDEYRTFSVNSYNEHVMHTYQSFPRNTVLTYTGPQLVEFEQLSGNLSFCDNDPCSITLGHELQTRNITINNVGGITW